MAYNSGNDGQFGMKDESTWGTAVTVDRFVEFVDEGVELEQELLESQAIRAGSSRVLRSNRYRMNRKGVAGPVSFEVATKGFGLLFKHAMGEVATATPSGGTNTRDHTFTLGNTYGMSFTMQLGRPDVGGTVRPFTYNGCKITGWELTAAVDEVVMFKPEIDAQDETTSTALASASYASGDELFYFDQGTLSIAGTPVDVRKFSIKADRGLKTDRRFVKGSPLKSEQVEAGELVLEGELELEFQSLTEYNRFVAGTVAALELVCVTETAIEGSLYPTLTVTAAAVQYTGGTPNVEGTDVLTLTLPFKVVDNLSDEPLTIVYRTDDATP